MALYQLNASGTAILRETDGALIPMAAGNLDYQAYLAWVAAGNTPDPVPTPTTVVPASVPMWQAKAALAAQASSTAGQTMLAAANAAVTATGGTVAIFWEYATTLDRADPNVATLGTALGLSSAQIDALFIAAAALTV